MQELQVYNLRYHFFCFISLLSGGKLFITDRLARCLGVKFIFKFLNFSTKDVLADEVSDSIWKEPG